MSDGEPLIERHEALNPVRTIEVGALKTRERGEAVADLFEETVEQNPGVDLVIGPEYGFYKWPQYVDWRDPGTRGEPLVFQEQNGVYSPLKGDEQVLTLLNKLILLARNTQKSIKSAEFSSDYLIAKCQV